jgi:NADH-quinone oxidoreductase subunit E
MGGPTTLTDPALYAKNGKSASAHTEGGAALTDADAKKPSAAANMRDAAVPKAPTADSSRNKK